MFVQPVLTAARPCGCVRACLHAVALNTSKHHCAGKVESYFCETAQELDGMTSALAELGFLYA